MGSKDKAESIIYAIRSYYDLARKKFLGKKEIFYLALTWAVYAKKHHPEQYKNDEISDLLIIGAFDTILFSQLNYPESVEALAYYMVNKEKALVVDYETRFNSLMSKVNFSQEYSTKKISEIEPYIFDESRTITHLTASDFRIEEDGFDQLELKAAGVLCGVIRMTLEFNDSGVKQIKELQNLDEIQEGLLYLMISLNLLYIAQGYFWSKLSEEDELKARIFEIRLNHLFEAHTGIDPVPFIRDIAKYVQEQGSGTWVQYFGSRLPKSLNIGIRPFVEITIRYGAFYVAVTEQKILQTSWELPVEEQQKCLQMFLKDQDEHEKDKLESADIVSMLKQRLNITEEQEDDGF